MRYRGRNYQNFLCSSAILEIEHRIIIVIVSLMNADKIQKLEPTNIDYWEKVLQAPSPAYQELFNAEQKYLAENIKFGMAVLDIGCGDGRNIRNILMATNKITGIDNDSKAIKDAKENFKENSSIKLIQADATHLPFEESSFDVVTFLMILPNLDQNKTLALQEATRVLKRGGFLLLSTFSDTAFDERMKVYKKTNAPIKKIEGTKVIFDESLGANVSEQFSREEIEKFGNSAGLTMAECNKVGVIAYLCKFKK